jgi:hypothetical protein
MSASWLRRIGGVPEVVWAPTVAALVLLAIGGLSLGAGQPWLFPSLGPTVYLQTISPRMRTADPYNTVVGHFVGLAAGFAGVYLVGAHQLPSVLGTHQLTDGRVYASVIAVFLTILVGRLCRAQHPPAAATTLLVSLGGFAGWKGAATVAAGVALVAVLGEAARRARVEGQKAATKADRCTQPS